MGRQDLGEVWRHHRGRRRLSQQGSAGRRGRRNSSDHDIFVAPVKSLVVSSSQGPKQGRSQGGEEMIGRRTLLTTAAAAGFVPAAPTILRAAETPGVTDTEIRIGSTMPYSGPASSYGTIGRADTAVFRMANDRGGFAGRKVNFISYDDAYSPPKTVEDARRLIEPSNGRSRCDGRRRRARGRRGPSPHRWASRRRRPTRASDPPHGRDGAAVASGTFREPSLGPRRSLPRTLVGEPRALSLALAVNE